MPWQREAAGSPFRRPGEGDSGHVGVAKLTERRLGAAGSWFPSRRVILTEKEASAGDPEASERPISDDTRTRSCLNPVYLRLPHHVSQ